MNELILENWQEIIAGLIALTGVIVNITPSKRDNSIFLIVKAIFDKIIPNNKKGGGTH